MLMERARHFHAHLQHATRRRKFAAVLLILITLIAISFLAPTSPAVTVPQTGGDVIGSVYAAIPDLGPSGTPRDIFLPDIRVFLRDVATLTSVGPAVTTDLGGRFIIAAQPSGTYQVCLNAPGYVPTCHAEAVVIESEPVYLPPVAITPRSNVVAGRARRRDGTPCLFKDLVFGVDAETSLLLTGIADGTGQAVSRRVRANDRGEYLFARVPRGFYSILASCEGARVSRFRRVEGLTALDLVLPNTGPQIRTIVAFANARGVRRVSPGETVLVSVKAVDPEGHTLHYRWTPSSSSTGFQSLDAPTVQWTLPTVKALHSMYVLVNDNRGGYALGRLDLSTDDQGAVFSGWVSGSDGAALGGARVSINGFTTETTEEGYFLLLVPRERPRYVVNITKDGYQLVSRVFHEPIVGEKYRLTRAQQFVVDPSALIDVIERENGSAKSQVVIRRDSLVDAAGNLASSPVTLSILTIDQRDPEGLLPGDYGAVDASGHAVTLTSFGAAQVEVKDQAGNSYDLLAGRPAVLRVPLYGGQLPAGEVVVAPPPTVSVWAYKSGTGRWREVGMANLVDGYYEAVVQRLGIYNLAVAVPEAAPLRLLLDATRGLVPSSLRVTVPTATGLDRVFAARIGDPISLIEHLPPQTAVSLEFLDAQRNPIPGSTQVVTTGPPSGVVLPVTPIYPYGPAPTAVLDAVLTAPHLPKEPATGFLTRIENDEAAAKKYYSVIDPENRSSDFFFWFANFRRCGLFGCTPCAVSRRVVYFNAGDLKFGREMNLCRMGDGRVAYWVTNYDSVADAVFARNRKDTVAMEHSPDPDPTGPAFTKFYVFDSDFFGTRKTGTDLDLKGVKYVPGLCMVCHGGSQASLIRGIDGTGDVESKFIPFDLDSFEYSGKVGVRRADQEDEFKTLNLELRSHTNPSQAVATLIAGWYGGVDLPRMTFDGTFVPFEWTSPVDQSALYRTVVAPSCRSCHVTRPTVVTGPGAVHGLSWATFELFNKHGKSIRSSVCSRLSMPQALVTWRNFWSSTSPHQPTVLGGAGLLDWPPGAPCPTP